MLWIMHLFKTLKSRREVGDGILNSPLSLHQRPFDEQTQTVSTGSGGRLSLLTKAAIRPRTP